MELRSLSKSEVCAWYRAELAEAFPPNERKPLDEIQNLLSGGCYEVLGLFEGAAGPRRAA